MRALAGVNTATAAASSGVSASIVSSLDGNSEGIISAQEMQAASIVSADQKCTVISLASAIDRTGAMRPEQDPHLALPARHLMPRSRPDLCRSIEQGRGSFGRRKLRPRVMLSGISQGNARAVRAMAGQKRCFSACDPGQTPASRAAKNLTNAELGKVARNLQRRDGQVLPRLGRARCLPAMKT